MCHPTTQHPISEAMPLVNALIEEAERNCIDISHTYIHALPDGRFDIAIYPYDGGFDALRDLLDLFVREQRSDAYEPTSWYASRSVGRWYIHSSYYGDESFFGAEAAAA